MGSSSSHIYPDEDLLDLRGRVAIVTGANSGLGIYILLHLVRRGAKVYLAARSQEKADIAMARLEDEGLGPTPGEIVWLDLDLTEPLKAKAAAEWFIERETRLDILVNNAAKYQSPSILGPYARTPDGINASMMINHISPFVFTKTLLPVLEHTASIPSSDVRIVNVSSVGHRWVPSPRYDSLEAFNNDFCDTIKPKTNVYCYTKLANILWTNELQRCFDKAHIPIVTMSVHPGSVMSEGNIRLFTSLTCGRLINWFFSLFFISPYEGGYTPAWAAASKEVAAYPEKYKGKYLVPYGIIEEASVDARREDLAQELWRTTEQLVRDFRWF
ncbi:NAD(P)-binding protein [Artomyces pyxidatus]|uniref:NAD(P)-binding protein n=1 Tax=Artomyces pyxidatus TaxID=48021 RepID=A0ACB8ST26_9AGAM|nr:NAD(P)-binding protein [Artomyces pyxidatus]